MTANMDFTTAKKVIENKVIRESIEIVAYHIERLEDSFDQLEMVYRLNVSPDVKKEAYKNLEKQDKLIEIAQDLKKRFQSLKPLRVLHSVKKEIDYDLAQLSIELELLEEMHFRLKRTYISFLNKYHRKATPVQRLVA